MKVVTTLLVLFFSLPAFTSDDLSGNKISCLYKSDSEIRLVGFHFTGKKVVNLYHEFHNIPLSITGHIYKTSSGEIHIYNIGNYEVANINRQTLFTKHDFNGRTYSYKDCKLIEGNIVKSFNQALKELKKLNKI